MTIKILILAAAIATLGTTSVIAQDAMKPADKMAAHDAMKPDAMKPDAMKPDAMKPDAMAAHKMTKAEKKTHDAMMKHDAMKPDAMKSSTPQ